MRLVSVGRLSGDDFFRKLAPGSGGSVHENGSCAIAEADQEVLRSLGAVGDIRLRFFDESGTLIACPNPWPPH